MAKRRRWIVPVTVVALLAFGVARFNTAARPPAKSVHAAELLPSSPTGLTLGTPTFRWQSPISGVRYRITVRRGTTTVWSGMFDNTEAAPPAAIVFEPGAEYTWQVEAIDPQGAVRLSSSPQSFVIS